jgi:hypothetical protein
MQTAPAPSKGHVAAKDIRGSAILTLCILALCILAFLALWSGACHGSKQEVAAGSRADRPCAIYLRAAQAYMLISMPTGTSTIFGAFQAIQVSHRRCAMFSRA